MSEMPIDADYNREFEEAVNVQNSADPSAMAARPDLHPVRHRSTAGLKTKLPFAALLSGLVSPEDCQAFIKLPAGEREEATAELLRNLELTDTQVDIFSSVASASSLEELQRSPRYAGGANNIHQEIGRVRDLLKRRPGVKAVFDAVGLLVDERGFKASRPRETTTSTSAAKKNRARLGHRLIQATLDLKGKGPCKDADPEIFFVENLEDPATIKAKKICGQCAVRAECLAYALEHEERFGIWGGLTTYERGRLKRRR